MDTVFARLTAPRRDPVELGIAGGGTVRVYARHASYGEVRAALDEARATDASIALLLIARFVEDEAGGPVFPNRTVADVERLDQATIVALTGPVLDACGVRLNAAPTQAAAEPAAESDGAAGRADPVGP